MATVTTPTLCVLQSRAARAFVKLVTLEPTRKKILFVQTLFAGFLLELPAMTTTTIMILAIDHIAVSHLSCPFLWKISKYTPAEVKLPY